MHMEPRMADEPAPYARGLVRPIVVQDQMDVELGSDAGVDRLDKSKELLTAMAAMTFANDFAGGHIGGCKQRRGSITPLVVRAPLGRPERHRQNRRGPIERLDLALFIHAQEQRAIR